MKGSLRLAGGELAGLGVWGYGARLLFGGFLVGVLHHLLLLVVHYWRFYAHVLVHHEAAYVLLLLRSFWRFWW